MKKIALALCAALSLGAPATANAQDAYIGEIRWFAFGFCPTGWSTLAGQSINVAANQALYALIGNTYGGNGSTTFLLPDLRGRVMISNGAGAGLQNYVLGQKGGAETATISYNALPANVVTGSSTPVAVVKAQPGADPATTVNVPSQFNVTGSGQSHGNLQPYLATQACIAMSGVFPTRQ